MIPKDNEFANGEYAVIEKTTDTKLNGTEVRVVGVVVDFSPLYRIYAIERKDGKLWSNGFKVFALTSRCLKPT